MTNNICDTCLKSDCCCLCAICGNHEPAVSSSIKLTRSKKKVLIDWISCNSCLQWVHPICSGLSNKEVQKLKTISKKSQIDHFYKCIACSLKIAKSLGITYTNFLKQKSSFRQTATECASKATQAEVSIDLQENSQGNNTNISLLNILKGETVDLEQQANPNKSSNTNCDKSIEKDNTVDFIRVVDNITNRHILKDSVSIKKELNKATSEKINIKHTYTLSKGGVAFHFKTQEDTNKFEKEVTKIFPGSTCSIPKSLIKRHKKFIIRNIDPSISNKNLTSSLQKTIQGKFYLRRFHSSRTRKPLPIVCVTCESSACDNILKTGVELFGSHFNCENYIKPIVHCFNCELFGHISINCLKKHRCENCGKSNHPFHCHNHCLESSFCVNCNKPGHPPSSRECPEYIKKKTIINHEISPVKYYFI